MDTKEKIVSKEEMIRLIDEGRFFEFFEAIDGSEWKYDKPIYLRLKENFMRGIYDIDFANRLNVFVSTLEDKPINNDIIENDKLDIKDILGKIKKLKFNTLLIRILDYSFVFGGAFAFMIISLVIITYAYGFFLKTNFISLISTPLITTNIILLICSILTFSIKEHSNRIYQFLVPLVALQNYSIEETTVIEKAKETITSFAYTKEHLTMKSSGYVVMIFIAFSGLILTINQGNLRNYTIQTYLYSPSFDSLLQNDKKVYQYVDSLVQKHKK